ncbi:MAG: hypothetical protein ACRDDD_12530 [Plesiomonas sp.]|uniref:hypothetical protein n=1 Tax=Plesiomonas sp. TaxID=2486279 RepID=UPI003EE80F02
MNQSQIIPSLQSAVLGSRVRAEFHYAMRVGTDVAPINREYAAWFWDAQMHHLKELHDQRHLLAQ